MSFLAPSFFSHNEEKKEKKEKEKGLQELVLLPIKQQEFCELMTFAKKTTIYKYDLLVGAGFEGGIKRLHMFIKDDDVFIRHTYKADEAENEKSKKKPEFEYLVFLKEVVFLIVRNENQEPEVFQVGGNAKIAVYLEAMNPVNGNVIYGCYISDQATKQYYESFTMDENAGAMLIYSFKAFTDANATK